MLAAVLVLGLLAPIALADDAVDDPPRGDLRLVVFGDFNGPYGATTYPAAVALVVRTIGEVWRPDLVLMPGDVVAGQSRALPDERFEQMWAAFDEVVAAPLRRYGTAYAVAIGNHDGSSDRAADGSFNFARERAAASAYWSHSMYDANLDYVVRSRFPFEYAFRFGEIFVAVIDASSASVDASTIEWLGQVLQQPIATSASMRIVMGHLPLFGVSERKNRPGEVVRDGRYLAQRMRAVGVDTYVSGHHAAYYPGRVEGLELLFTGGVGAHALLGASAPARSAVTIVDLWFSPLLVRYTTFDPDDMQPIPLADLPPRIDGIGGPVERSTRASP